MQSDGRHSTIRDARHEGRGGSHTKGPERTSRKMRFWGFAALPLSRRRPRRAWGRDAMGVAVSGLSLRAHGPQCQRPLTTAKCGNTCSVSAIESRHLRRFFGSTARSIAVPTMRPKTPLFYEPMFDCKQTLTTRLADAVDLMIDFATLGEYGLEPVGRARPASVARPRLLARGRGGEATIVSSTGSPRAMTSRFRGTPGRDSGRGSA